MSRHDTSSHYPDGGVGSAEETVRCRCDDCDETWEVEGTDELGAFVANDEDDWKCPECGREVDEDGEVPRKDDEDA